jgi:hypothetical protein
MVTLTGLKKQLANIGTQRAAQARLVEEIEAPRRRLAEMEAAEREAAERLSALEAEITQTKAELSDVDVFLAQWEPMEAKLASAYEVVGELERSLVLSYYGFANLDKFQMNDLWRAMGQMVDLVEIKRQERARLQAQLKQLGA